MKLQPIRIKIQVLSLTMIILIPVLESYKRLLRYLPPNIVGSLWEIYGRFADYAPEYLKGGYFSWLVVLFDGILGNIGGKTPAMQQFLANFGGSYWSVTIAGITFVDPLAFLQVLLSRQSVSWVFVISALIPILLAVLLGRVFCSWLCPINTVFELAHSKHMQKYQLNSLKVNLVTFPYLRYILLGTGLLLTLTGITVFPYILPYVLLGRFLFYLTTGTIFWAGLFLLLSMVFINTFVQKGFWCNYLCPTGALLKLISQKRVVQIKHDREKCNPHCSYCRDNCAWGASPKEEDFANCTNCAVCVDKCPRKALSYRK